MDNDILKNRFDTWI